MSSEGYAQPSDKRVLQAALEENWQVSLEGRADVKKPKIIVEGDEDIRSVAHGTRDVIFVMDGGQPKVEPASVGHTHERIESIYDIKMFSSDEIRFSGETGDNQYGGLVGEVKRIIDMHRRGFGPYDRMDIDTYDDQVNDYGADQWVATWSVWLINYAQSIEQDALR